MSSETWPKSFAVEGAKDSLPDLLANYREARTALIAALPKELSANGKRIKMIGVQSESWRGTVKELDKYEARSQAADMVYVFWDCGNRYPVAIDEIEVLKK